MPARVPPIARIPMRKSTDGNPRRDDPGDGGEPERVGVPERERQVAPREERETRGSNRGDREDVGQSPVPAGPSRTDGG